MIVKTIITTLQKKIILKNFAEWNIFTVLILIMSMVLVSCEDALVDSETYGTIQGVVLDDSTGTPVVHAAITTSPATEAIVTDDDGEFKIEDIPTGDYTISVKKRGYARTSVSVAVRELKTTNTTILIGREEEDENKSQPTVSVDITNWWNESSNDSVHVHVGYRIENTGTADIDKYEITFRIENARGDFFHLEEGMNLQAGRSRVDEFEKYIRDDEADLVEVYDIWLQSPD